jgi:hypothetical protein
MEKLGKIIIGIICIIAFFFIIGIFVSSNNGNNSQTGYNTYTNQYMSFQYPAGWQTVNNSEDGVNVYNGTENKNSGWFSVIPYGNNGSVNNMDDFQVDMGSAISNSNPPTVQNGTINGTAYTFINNPNPSDGTFSIKYCFFVKNGEGAIVSGDVENIGVLEHVVATFN